MRHNVFMGRPQQAPALPQIVSGPIQQNDVLLLTPFYPKDPVASFAKHVLTPSTAFTSLAAVTPSDWNIRFWDENLLHGPVPVATLPAIVGITVHLTFAKRAYALADRFRAMGCVVVMGGLHVSSCSDEVAPHCDAMVVGDGVPVWPLILADHRRGQLQKTYDGSFKKAFSDTPAPDRSILPKKAYLTTASVIATRGCSNRCHFCYLSTKGLRMPYHQRRVEQIVDEIRALGERYVVFTDNNLTADFAFTRALCLGLKDLNIIWTAAVTVESAQDPELLQLMADSGCTGVFVGFETLSQDNLSETHKGGPGTDVYSEAVRRFHQAGIQVNASFVFGFDHDGPDVFKNTLRWIEANKLESATFHILTPYPGTPFYRRMQREGRIVHSNWELYDTAHAVFEPLSMTRQELEAGYRWIYQNTFSMKSIWRRRPAGFMAAFSYLLMSLLYKKLNPLWGQSIRWGLTRSLWRPFVFAAWARHMLGRRLKRDKKAQPMPQLKMQIQEMEKMPSTIQKAA